MVHNRMINISFQNFIATPADVTRKREPAIFVKFGIDKVPEETSPEFKVYENEEKYRKSLEELKKVYQYNKLENNFIVFINYYAAL